MNKKLFKKAALDGLIQSLILFCLETFLVSKYFSNVSLKRFLLVGLFSAVLSTVVFVMFTIKESTNKAIMFFWIISTLCFILCDVVMLALRLTFKLDFLPLREVNNANGILIVFAIGCFMLSTIILRVCAFIVLIIKNQHYRSQKNKI